MERSRRANRVGGALTLLAAMLALAAAAGQGNAAPELENDPLMPMAGTQPGTAFTGTLDGAMFLAIDIAPGPVDVSQPAAMREGSCEAPGAVVTQLEPVINGESFSEISLTPEELEASGLILVVEASESEAAVASCGAFVNLEPFAASPPVDVVEVEELPDTGSGASSGGDGAAGVLLLAVAGVLALGSVGLFGLGMRRS